MDSIVAEIQTLAEKADEAGRDNIMNTLQDLQSRLETPTDTFFKIYNSHIKVAVIYVGIELGLFRELVKDNAGTLTVTQLAQKSGASPILLERLLRYLSSVGVIANVGPGEFEANKSTYVLSHPMADSGVVHAFDLCGPAIQALPSFLAETKYQDITSNTKTPFQKGFNTELSCFQWLPQQPKLFHALQKVMTGLQSSNWLADFDLLDKKAFANPQPQSQASELPFLVDVGGGYGHQCVKLLEKYPNLHGHLILQDLPEAVNNLSPIDGVKAMAQDFFDKQAVEGAKFYYLRRIMHDWPDELCVKILQNLAAAMNSESRILIDEVVLPDVNVHWHATMGDISMGILFGGKERTKRQWESLVVQSGLRLVQIHTYSTSLYNSVIVLES